MASGPLVYILLAGVTPVLAAAVPFLCLHRRVSPRVLVIMLGLSSGILFAIATLDLIPEGLEMMTIEKDNDDGSDDDGEEHVHEHSHEGSSGKVVFLGVGCGYLILLLLQHLFSEEGGHGHSHIEAVEEHVEDHADKVGETSSPRTSPTSASGTPGHMQKATHKHSNHSRDTAVSVDNHDLHTVAHDQDDQVDKKKEMQAVPTVITQHFSHVAFIGMAVHSLVDGLVIAGAFSASQAIGARVAFAIVLHKVPDGVVISSLFASAAFGPNHGQGSRRAMIAWMIAVALSTPVGALVGLALLQDISRGLLAFVLGFGGGSFIYLACTAIVPELVQSPDKGTRTMALCNITGGYILFVIYEAVFHVH